MEKLTLENQHLLTEWKKKEELECTERLIIMTGLDLSPLTTISLSSIATVDS